MSQAVLSAHRPIAAAAAAAAASHSQGPLAGSAPVQDSQCTLRRLTCMDGCVEIDGFLVAVPPAGMSTKHGYLQARSAWLPADGLLAAGLCQPIFSRCSDCCTPLHPLMLQLATPSLQHHHCNTITHHSSLFTDHSLQVQWNWSFQESRTSHSSCHTSQTCPVQGGYSSPRERPLHSGS